MAILTGFPPSNRVSSTIRIGPNDLYDLYQPQYVSASVNYDQATEESWRNYTISIHETMPTKHNEIDESCLFNQLFVTAGESEPKK